MTRNAVLEYCSAKPDAFEDYPFGDDVAVFKVAKKMFAFISLKGVHGLVNLKCDPGLALELRDRHDAVKPGYHSNKRHWNTIDLAVPLDGDDLREMIDHSYDLVVAGLPRSQRANLRRH